MKRREFLAGVAASATGLMLHTAHAAAAEPTAAAARRPNLLLIMTDQQFAGALSCAGNPYLKTPNMDSLAAAGTRFEQAYTSQPLCTPLRTSLLMGRMPHETGITYNCGKQPAWTRDPAAFPMLGAVLTQAGYTCAMIGKWHVPIEKPQRERHGFEVFQSITGDDTAVAQQSVEYIRARRDKPFFLFASLLNPHNICEYARGGELPCGPIPPVPPASDCPPLPDNFEIPANEPEMLRAVQKLNLDAYPTVDWKPDQWRQYRWAYYRLIEKVDREIGVILQALRESGQEENTVVIFVADHGDGGASHRWNQKQILYEESVRVPLIISKKGTTPGGRVERERLVSTGLDLFPTLCDYAGAPVPTGLCGRSLRPLAEGKNVATWRNFTVTETTFAANQNLLGLEGRMVRTADYKYLVYSTGKVREQLFDMRRDPGEKNSLTGSEAHRQVLEQHRKILADWQKETGDRFPEPVKSLAGNAGGTGTKKGKGGGKGKGKRKKAAAGAV